jgi:hypothetical protein
MKKLLATLAVVFGAVGLAACNSGACCDPCSPGPAVYKKPCCAPAAPCAAPCASPCAKPCGSPCAKPMMAPAGGPGAPMPAPAAKPGAPAPSTVCGGGKCG